MKNTQKSGRYQKLISLRVTHQEKARLEEQASIAGLSVSEYMRRKFFGGRPIIAKTDECMVHSPHPASRAGHLNRALDALERCVREFAALVDAAERAVARQVEKLRERQRGRGPGMGL